MTMAVPIIPAQDVDTSTSWYRDSAREFAITDLDGNLLTFFER
jgi:hypothetical protein